MTLASVTLLQPGMLAARTLPAVEPVLLAAVSMRAMRHVCAQGVSGSLPPFAARLGLKRSEFALLNRALELDFMGKLVIADGPELEPDFPYGSLLQLLWDNRQRSTAMAWGAAAAIASACFGQNHLWQDLGLDGRAEVNVLVAGHFPALFQRNVHDLKWKRFLFLELGDLLGQAGLRPPHCEGCDQFAVCYADAPPTLSGASA